MATVAGAEKEKSSGGSGSSDATAKSSLHQLWVSNGLEPYTGLCLFFVRVNVQKAITMANIHQECNFGVLESNGGGLLGAFEDLLTTVFIPALANQEKWGDLAGPEGQQLKQSFLAKLRNFASVLSNAKASVSDMVHLSKCTEVDLSVVTSPAEIPNLVMNSEFVEATERQATIWCNEIEQVRVTHVDHASWCAQHSLLYLISVILQ